MTFDLLRKFRSLGTLVALVVLMLVGVTWGWSAVTSPLPETADPPICEDTTIAAGDAVNPAQVTVSVINAGSRDGLAGRTMDALVDRGFVKGELGNAPTRTNVKGAQIWTDDPQSAAVQLVATYLAKNGKGVVIVEQETQSLGINIVVGDQFTDVVRGRKSLTAGDDLTVCSPPPPAD